MKCMADGRENKQCDLGSKRVKIMFRVLENSVGGPLHMSPVDRPGSVSEISPGHSFLYILRLFL